MTASIRILTTSTLDSSPSILIISPNGSKTLINCGEGCQRAFLESASKAAGSLRVRSVNRICLTHVGYGATGGLPGMILTTADVAQASSSANNNNNHSNNSTAGNSPVGNLEIIGPKGTSAFIHSLRHFVKRDRFPLHVLEGQVTVTPNEAFSHGNNSLSTSRGRGKKRKTTDNIENNNDHNEGNLPNNCDIVDHGDIFAITTIPLKRKIKILPPPSDPRISSNVTDSSSPNNEVEININSFIFTTAPIPGKFQISKAKALGIPPGPLYSKLKSGQSITFQHPATNDYVMVQPNEVLDGGSDGITLSFIYCPDEYVMNQLINNSNGSNQNYDNHGLNILNKYKASTQNNAKHKEEAMVMEVMIHCTPKILFETQSYQNWLNEFGPDVNHITLHTIDEVTYQGGNEHIDGSPFKSAMMGVMTRNWIDPNIFPKPFPNNNATDTTTCGDINSSTKCVNQAFQKLGQNDQVNSNDLAKNNITDARPNMEYILIPLIKKGLNKKTIPLSDNQVGSTSNHGISSDDYDSIQALVQSTGALDEANQIHSKYFQRNPGLTLSNNTIGPQLIFTGTGSAIPCKHRNVTGMYLQMSNGKGMLLDVGEGTIGQLLRTWSNSKDNNSFQNDEENHVRYQECLKNIKAVWISHPHADHHLGIIRFLTERNAILSREVQEGQSTYQNVIDDPIILMAQPSIFEFLKEYSAIDPNLRSGYIAVDCRDFTPGKVHPFLNDLLFQNLGVTGCISVPVHHCPNAFAIVLDGTPFGRVTYSGDCRPSGRLVEVGMNTDLLIHEATFENGMEEEALLKLHSTVGEAVSVGKKMNAKAIILTHFSQRYPRIPPLKENDHYKLCNDGDDDECPICFAFDFMKITPETLKLAALLTPALRLLYPEEEEEDDRDNDNSADQSSAHEISTSQPSSKEILSVPGAFAYVLGCPNK